MDDSSDDDIGLTGMTNRLCLIDKDGLIHSVSSNDYPIKFSADSFVLHYIDSMIMVYMNPMFLWRLIYVNKNRVDNEREFDFQKLRLFVTRLGPDIYMTHKDIEYKLDDVIHYKPGTGMFDSIYNSYSRLYRSTQRGYDQTEHVKEFFDSYIVLLRYLGD